MVKSQTCWRNGKRWTEIPACKPTVRPVSRSSSGEQWGACEQRMLGEQQQEETVVQGMRGMEGGDGGVQPR